MSLTAFRVISANLWLLLFKLISLSPAPLSERGTEASSLLVEAVSLEIEEPILLFRVVHVNDFLDFVSSGLNNVTVKKASNPDHLAYSTSSESNYNHNCLLQLQLQCRPIEVPVTSSVRAELSRRRPTL